MKVLSVLQRMVENEGRTAIRAVEWFPYDSEIGKCLVCPLASPGLGTVLLGTWRLEELCAAHSKTEWPAHNSSNAPRLLGAERKSEEDEGKPGPLRGLGARSQRRAGLFRQGRNLRFLWLVPVEITGVPRNGIRDDGMGRQVAFRHG